MQQQGFTPEIFLQDATIQDQRYVEEAGKARRGRLRLLADRALRRLQQQGDGLYRAWLAQVDPSAEPNTYGVYAWSAARLFVQQAVALGGRLNRQTLIQSLAKVKDWTGNGIHAPQQVGAETSADCVAIVQRQEQRLEEGLARQVPLRTAHRHRPAEADK